MAKVNENKPFTFKPFSQKQKKLVYFWDSRSPYASRELIIADGAVRSGKTLAMTCSFLLWSMRYFDGQSFILAGRSIGALKRNVVNDMLRILKTWKWDYKYNRSENYILIGNNIYYLFGATTEASQDVIQGLTAAGLYADEVTLFPRSFVDQAMSRCSVDDSKLFFNCNPGSPHHYIKKEYIDQAEEKKVYHLHFVMNDNNTLSPSIKARYERLYSGVFYRRYILGEWVMAEGVIYDMFDPDRNTYARLPKHKMKYLIGADYGAQNPTVFLEIHVDDMGDRVKAYVENEYYFSGRDEGWTKTDAQYGDDFESFIQADPLRVYVDPSASSFISELKFRGFNATQADNTVLDGIRLLSTMFQNGSLKINRRCTHLLKEIAEYSWDEKAQEKGIDQPLKVSDHCITGGTLVDTTEGQKPISELVGTTGKVFSYSNGQTVERNYFDVRKTIEQTDVLEIEFEDGRKVKATPDHLFLTDAGWKPLSELKPGDNVVEAVVKSITYAGKQDVFNMEVEDTHNYSVEGGIIIHNCLDALRYALFSYIRYRPVFISQADDIPDVLGGY